jgi:hypothetical protein
MSSQQSNTEAGEKPSYPAYWDFDEDGPLLSARFVKFDQGQTKMYGPKPICVIEADGEERSLWLTQTVLYQRFRDELLRRPGRTLAVGERISVERHEKKRTENGRYEYTPFTIIFHDAPELSTSDLFELDTGPAGAKSEEPSEPDVDDVPF